MSQNYCYTVKNPDISYKLSLLMIGISLVLTVFALLPEETFSIVPILVIIVMLLLPSSLCALWAKRYSIQVKGRTLTVQKMFRLTPFMIDMSDITKAVYIVAETRAGTNVKLTVYTTSDGKFSVESLMDNGHRLQEQIGNEISRDRIKVVHKSFVK